MKSKLFFILLMVIIFNSNCGIKYYHPPQIQDLEYSLPDIVWNTNINGEILHNTDFHTYMNHENDLLIFILENKKAKKVKNEIVCMKISSGELLWQSPFPYGEFKDIEVNKNLSILLFQTTSEKIDNIDRSIYKANTSLIALNLKTGKYLWKRGLKLYENIIYKFLSDSQSVSIISFEPRIKFLREEAEDNIFTIWGRNGTGYRINLKNNKIIWHKNFEARHRVVATDSLTIFKDYDSEKICAVNHFNGKEVWKTEQEIGDNFEIIGNRLFGTSENDDDIQSINVYDVNTGKRILFLEDIPNLYTYYDFFVYQLEERKNEYFVSNFGKLLYVNFDNNKVKYLNKQIDDTTESIVDDPVARTLLFGPLLGPLLGSDSDDPPTFGFKSFSFKNDTLTLPGYNDKKLEIRVLYFDRNKINLSEIKLLKTDIEKNDENYLESKFESWGYKGHILIGLIDRFFLYNMEQMDYNEFIFSEENLNSKGSVIYPSFLYLSSSIKDVEKGHRSILVYDILNQKIVFEIPVSSKCGSKKAAGSKPPIEAFVEKYVGFDNCQFHLLRETHRFNISSTRLKYYEWPKEILNEKIITYALDANNDSITKLIAYNIGL